MHKISIAIVALATVVTTAEVRGQEPSRPALTPLEVEIVISRFQGDKRISSVPYLMSVNAGEDYSGGTSLQMGTDVPVPTTTIAPQVPGGANTPIRSFNYRSVGTTLSADARRAVDGGFEVQLGIDDTSIYTTGEAKEAGAVLAGMPVFRSFETRNTLLLRDGQTRQFTAATDRVSGEVVRVSVTLRVVK